jgi:hypothetical protein
MEIFITLNMFIQVFFIILLGLIMGSFISLVSHRLVSKESMFLTRSKCVHCNSKLKIRSLVPIFSWILQRGKCLNCSKKISIRYPLIEFFSLNLRNLDRLYFQFDKFFYEYRVIQCRNHNIF